MPRGDRNKRTETVEWLLPIIGLLIALSIAFGVGILVASNQADPPTKEQQQQYASAKTRYAQAVTGNLTDTEANYSAYPDQNSYKCYYANHHDSADLCAQWRAAVAAQEAAKWTHIGAWFALLGTVLSGIALACLLWSLRQTERSWSKPEMLTTLPKIRLRWNTDQF